MDELVDIGEFAVPLSWQREMVLQGYEPADHDTDELVKFCNRLEQAADKDCIPRKRKNETVQNVEISKETPSEGEASGTETSKASVHGITEADEELMDDVFEDINN